MAATTNTIVRTSVSPTRVSVSAPGLATRDWGVLWLLSAVWGGSFFFVGLAINEMTPLTIVTIRVGLAAAVLTGYLYLTGRKLPSSPRTWASFAVMGISNNVVPFSLVVWGQQYIDSSLASILVGATPIFSVLLAHLLTHDERMTLPRLAGVLFGWAGVALLIGVESLEGFGTNIWGQLAVLGAALSYSLSAIYGRRFKRESTEVLSAGMLVSSTVMMIPLTLLLEQPFDLSPGATSWLAVIALAVVSTAFAYLLYFRILARAGATNAVLVTFLVPVSAILLGVLVLGERPGWNAFAGLALIFTGLAALDGRVLRWARQRALRLTSQSAPLT